MFEEFDTLLTFTSTTFCIFQISIAKPMNTLTRTTKLVSLSRTYRQTTKDWNTLKKTDLTDRPSKDFLLRQNWISVRL